MCPHPAPCCNATHLLSAAILLELVVVGVIHRKQDADWWFVLLMTAQMASEAATVYLAVFWPYMLVLLFNLLVGVRLSAKLMGVLKAA